MAIMNVYFCAELNEDLPFTVHASLFVIICTIAGVTPVGRGKETVLMTNKGSETASDLQEKMMEAASEVKEEIKESTSGVIELFVLALVALLAMVALGSLFLFVAIF
ncbi:MAG TPA: hypothetical protein VE288_07215 [Rubrobacteraceae bacterium]|nr:hypothetical protein [Rubrobacteraceae bacterium]